MIQTRLTTKKAAREVESGAHERSRRTASRGRPAVPPFSLGAGGAELQLKFVLFGRAPKAVRSQFESLLRTWPRASLTHRDSTSAPRTVSIHSVQRLVCKVRGLGNLAVRQQVLAMATSLGKSQRALVLRQLGFLGATCVVLLPDLPHSSLRVLDQDFQPGVARLGHPLVVFVGKKPRGAPRAWDALSAPTAVEGFALGFERFRELFLELVSPAAR